jgi:hypothetical protein
MVQLKRSTSSPLASAEMHANLYDTTDGIVLGEIDGIVLGEITIYPQSGIKKSPTTCLQLINQSMARQPMATRLAQ